MGSGGADVQEGVKTSKGQAMQGLEAMVKFLGCILLFFASDSIHKLYTV